MDLDAIYKIKDEGLAAVAGHGHRVVSDRGPRPAADELSQHPRGRGVGDQAADRVGPDATSRQETWGPFGRGWANEKFTANVVTPQPFPLIAFPRAWTPGTERPRDGRRGRAPSSIATEDFSDVEGKLNGKIVLAARPTDGARRSSPPLGRRFTDQELVDLQAQPVNAGPRPRRRARGGPPADPNFTSAAHAVLRQRRRGRDARAGNGRNDHGAILVPTRRASIATPRNRRWSRRRSWWPPSTTTASRGCSSSKMPVHDRAERAEPLLRRHARRVQRRRRDPRHRQRRRGGDARRALRLVARRHRRHRQRRRLGRDDGGDAHPEGDGRCGCAARCGWRCGRARSRGCSGRARTSSSSSAIATRWQLKPAHAKLSAYFNMDNGTGAIRGVYLQGNEAVRPMFAAWMEPFRNLGMTTLTIRNTGGTDHVPFDEVGLPGFQFIQDPVEYGTHSHHTNMDVYDRLQARGPDEERRHHRVVRLPRGQPRRAAAAQAAATRPPAADAGDDAPVGYNLRAHESGYLVIWLSGH